MIARRELPNGVFVDDVNVKFEGLEVKLGGRFQMKRSAARICQPMVLAVVSSLTAILTKLPFDTSNL